MDAKEILVPILLFTMITVLAWIVFSTIRRYLVVKMQTGVQAKLLDRIDSSQALLTYVETPAGRDFLDSLTVERQSSPYRSILAGVQYGILLIVFGAALVVLHLMRMLPADGFFVMGALPIALGVGFLLAAAATFVLSRNFGLLDGKRPS